MNEQTKTILYTFIAIIFVGIIAFAAGVFSFGEKTPTSAVITDEQGFSGKSLPLDPDRAMAGAPCHAMAGQIMGDCAIREIEFEAWRYDWSEPTITVRSGELVRITATSRDVAHGFAIPDLGFNLAIEPGKTSVGEFMAPAPGTYDYGCSINCGPGHHNHRGQLVVLE